MNQTIQLVGYLHFWKPPYHQWKNHQWMMTGVSAAVSPISGSLHICFKDILPRFQLIHLALPPPRALCPASAARREPGARQLATERYKRCFTVPLCRKNRCDISCNVGKIIINHPFMKISYYFGYNNAINHP